jgi:hypothetical protein
VGDKNAPRAALRSIVIVVVVVSSRRPASMRASFSRGSPAAASLPLPPSLPASPPPLGVAAPYDSVRPRECNAPSRVSTTFSPCGCGSNSRRWRKLDYYTGHGLIDHLIMRTVFNRLLNTEIIARVSVIARAVIGQVARRTDIFRAVQCQRRVSRLQTVEIRSDVTGRIMSGRMQGIPPERSRFDQSRRSLARAAACAASGPTLSAPHPSRARAHFRKEAREISGAGPLQKFAETQSGVPRLASPRLARISGLIRASETPLMAFSAEDSRQRSVRETRSYFRRISARLIRRHVHRSR